MIKYRHNNKSCPECHVSIFKQKMIIMVAWKDFPSIAFLYVYCSLVCAV